MMKRGRHAPHISGGMYGTGYCDYFFFSAGAGAAAGASAAAGAAAGASAAAGAGAVAFGASFFWQPIRAASKADRITIFFMSKSPRVCGCGPIARRGIIHSQNPLPSDYPEKKRDLIHLGLSAAIRFSVFNQVMDPGTIGTSVVQTRNCMPRQPAVE